MNFTVCPCNKSQLLLRNTVTDICFKCGRININNNGSIDDPIEYWKNLPQLYKDMTVSNMDGNKYVPYFMQERNKIVFLEQNSTTQAFEYVVAKCTDSKIEMETAERYDFMEFNKVMMSFGK